MRGESGCSDVSSRIFKSYSADSPFSRRAQRSLPPITADSTSKLSHFHGALRVPATTAWSPLTLVVGRWSPSPSLPSGSSGARSERTPKTSSREATHVEWREPTGALRESSSDGTWASERYSAKRLAEKLSAAQLRIARKARPAGSGRRVPRAKYAGTPARARACSSSPTYCCGERIAIAISSKRTLRSASFRIRRAISTHSRPSPGAENHTSSPVRVLSGGGSFENR